MKRREERRDIECNKNPAKAKPRLQHARGIGGGGKGGKEGGRMERSPFTSSAGWQPTRRVKTDYDFIRTPSEEGNDWVKAEEVLRAGEAAAFYRHISVNCSTHQSR